ncbi:MAG TPA: hypothetical protein VIG73_01630 [Cerasibacillus sp.]|uniref:hypothetical protein n=1 Tax=Cerasibacillus sp. TaxID=2498711 RepID=UPI002F3EFEA2
MCHFRTVTLKNGAHERKRLVIEFTDPNRAIIGEFLMSDSQFVNKAIYRDVLAVLNGEKAHVTTSGNRCHLDIKPKQTVITDLYADMFADVDTYPTCEIETHELKQLMDMWFKKLEEFKRDIAEE